MRKCLPPDMARHFNSTQLAVASSVELEPREWLTRQLLSSTTTPIYNIVRHEVWLQAGLFAKYR